MKNIPENCLLGIAITTYNRKDMVLELIKTIERLTRSEYFLLVCDDGSVDGTYELLTDLGVCCIGNKNKGIAWNKNRGLFFFLNVCKADYIILMDDDVIPTLVGWEMEWINAAQKFGHVSYLPPSYPCGTSHSPMTSNNPGIGSIVAGALLAQSAKALSGVGYMDTRFGRYGHEHSDLSIRFVRAGFGGVQSKANGNVYNFFFLMDIGIELLPSETSGTPDEIEKNGYLLDELKNDPVYRSPWNNDQERSEFLSEFGNGFSQMAMPLVPLTLFNSDSYAEKNRDVIDAGWEPFVHYFIAGYREGRPI